MTVTGPEPVRRSTTSASTRSCLRVSRASDVKHRARPWRDDVVVTPGSGKPPHEEGVSMAVTVGFEPIA
jgi:hypothetical protein